MRPVGSEWIVGISPDPYGLMCAAVNSWAISQVSSALRSSCSLRVTGALAGPDSAKIAARVAPLEPTPRSRQERLPQRALDCLAILKVIIEKYGPIIGEGFPIYMEELDTRGGISALDAVRAPPDFWT